MTSTPNTIDRSPNASLLTATPGAWTRARVLQIAQRNAWNLLGGGALLGAIIKIFWIIGRALTFSPVSPDEVYFLWSGWAINRGMVPYRDFQDFKPPLVFFTHAVALKLLGLERQQYRYFFSWLVLSSILALAISLMLRKVNKGVILALVFFIFVLWINPSYHDSSLDDAESIGLSYYLLGTASLLANARSHRIADIAGGILLSCAVLSKEPFALTVLPTWMAFVAMRFEEGGRTEARRTIVRTISGVAIVAAALVGYLVITGSVGDYVTHLLRYLPFAKRICVDAGVWTPGPFFLEWEVRWRRLHPSLYNFGSLGVAAPLLLAPFLLSRGKQWIAVGFGALGIFCGLYAVTLGGCFFRHYYQLAMPSLFFFMAMGALRLSPVFASLTRRRGAYFALLFALVPGSPVLSRIDVESIKKYPRNGPGEDPALIEYVQQNSAPDDTIFTTGLPGIYLYANRRNAVREAVFYDLFLILYPGNTDEERLAPVYDELVKSRPKIIIVTENEWQKRVRTANALWVPYIQKYGYKKVDDRIYLRPD